MKVHLLIASVMAAAVVGCSSAGDDDTSPAVVVPPGEDAGPVVDTSGAEEDRRRVWMKVTTYPELGITLELRRTYAEAVELEPPTTRVGDRTYPGEYWTMAIEGSSEEPVTDRASIPTGGEVVHQATVHRPDCDDPDLTPDISFTLPGRTDDGTRFVDRIEPSNPASDFATALEIYCRIGIAAEVFPSSTNLGGRNTVSVRVSNGTDSPVRLTIPALTGGTAIWTSGSATVPPNASASVELRGRGLDCDAGQDVPWEPGRVLVDGVATSLPVLTDWCTW